MTDPFSKNLKQLLKRMILISKCWPGKMAIIFFFNKTNVRTMGILFLFTNQVMACSLWAPSQAATTAFAELPEMAEVQGGTPGLHSLHSFPNEPYWHWIIPLDLDEMPHYGTWELASWVAAKAWKYREFLPTGWNLANGKWEAGGIWAKTFPPPPACRGLFCMWFLRAAFPGESYMPSGQPCQAPATSLLMGLWDGSQCTDSHSALLCLFITLQLLFPHCHHLSLHFPSKVATL